MSIDSISQTIDRALTAAGLNTRSGPIQAVTATIEKALAAAGIAQRRASPTTTTPRPIPTAGVGQFLALSHADGKTKRSYKLYVPSAYAGKPMPLIVMLHGCKQNPDDFAAGTRMNEFAERDGFLVAYPAQTARENGANCWNWFEPSQQTRDGAEPSIIAGIVEAIGGSYEVDASRVFVAGLSAGAAMAVILGAAYPEVFAGVGAHSGLPLGAAHDVTTAFSAMAGRRAASTNGVRGVGVPTIVFHGDADSTVAASNGQAIVEQAIAAFARSETTLRKVSRDGPAPEGEGWSTANYVDAAGRHRVESWTVRGGAHTWFGGSPEGSYTDAHGPDASAEMVRFFLSAKKG